MSTSLAGIPTLAPHFGFIPPVPRTPTYSAIRDSPDPLAPNEAVDETLHFNYPGSDIILRSCDSYNFRLLKLYIELSSPVLRKLIQSVSNTSGAPNDGKEQESLPVVKLPERKATLYSLLTFIFPATPALPPTAESIMELLAVAQKYQMDSVLSHIRGAVAQKDPPFIRPETAFHIYCLAQHHELYKEVVQAARVTFRLPMVIEDLGDRLDSAGMTGAYLHELRKHHERVRTDLRSALLQFRSFGLPNDVKSLLCRNPGAYNYDGLFPHWINDYINSIAEAPHLFNPTDFNSAWARHFQSSSTICSCASMPNGVIDNFWEALTAVVHTTIEKVYSALALVKEEPTSENSDPPSVLLFLDLPEASIILRSSDQVNFRIHKPVLAMSSPFFKDLLSLPQPPDDELVDGLPVVTLSEDADLLNCLISLLYPISPVIPDSYEKVFALLAACQKYDMEPVQSNIRAAIKLGTFPAPEKSEAFRAYAMASSLGLVPEMENAAQLTLGQPMTFESLGEGLRSFKGGALCDLIRYRKRSQ
ncbi:hypothetical protein V8E53_004387 [Lactarius tabidus]